MRSLVPNSKLQFILLKALQFEIRNYQVPLISTRKITTKKFRYARNSSILRKQWKVQLERKVFELNMWFMNGVT